MVKSGFHLIKFDHLRWMDFLCTKADENHAYGED